MLLAICLVSVSCGPEKLQYRLADLESVFNENLLAEIAPTPTNLGIYDGQGSNSNLDSRAEIAQPDVTSRPIQQPDQPSQTIVLPPPTPIPPKTLVRPLTVT